MGVSFLLVIGCANWGLHPPDDVDGTTATPPERGTFDPGGSGGNSDGSEGDTNGGSGGGDADGGDSDGGDSNGGDSGDDATDDGPGSIDGAKDFAARCAAPDVLKCVDFDDASDIAGEWGDPSGVLPGDLTTLELDTDVRASGASSIRFTIPSNAGPDPAGSYFTNFSDDRMTQFGEGETFFVQWRQRFSTSMLETDFLTADGDTTGFKLDIIGTGDAPGCTTSGADMCQASCTALEVVTTSSRSRGFPVMYNSCDGSTSHGAYDPFEEYFEGTYKLQNARPDPYCLYSQVTSDEPEAYFPPTGNCFPYVAEEWMTFQVQIEIGHRQEPNMDEFSDSYVRMWVGREGQPSEPVVDWGPYNLTAGDPELDWKFGKIWLLPYMTGKTSTQAHDTAYTWYDDLIISRGPIADPS